MLDLIIIVQTDRNNLLHIYSTPSWLRPLWLLWQVEQMATKTVRGRLPFGNLFSSQGIFFLIDT